MGMEIEGMEQVKLLLQRITGVVDVANAELKTMANEVAEVARDMAPIDYGDLKSAIKVRFEGAQGTGGRFVKGGGAYAIYIDNDTPVQDPFKQKYGTETVGEYAWLVYQYMGYGNVPGFLPDGRPFNPSEDSVKAGKEKGVDAGGLFLERAAIAKIDEIYQRMATIVDKRIAALDSEEFL